MTGTVETNWDEMSDEDFLKLDPIEPAGATTDKPVAADAPVVDEVVADTGADVPVVDGEAGGADAEGTGSDTAEGGEDVVGDDELMAPAKADGVQAPKAGQDQSNKSKADVPAKTAEELAKEAATAAATETKDIDYKAFYESLVGTPIKANGKEITLKDLEEVRRLVQKGAGFGKAMQDLAPHRKTLTMIEKAGITEDDLSLLIDLKNKNPDAVKKVLKDSGLDPLDINPEDAATYVPGNHKVTDAEVNFNLAIDELTAVDGGTETLQVLHSTWDPQSKQALWESPELLQTIHEQRQSGIYSQITTELDRQRALGTIPPGTPFLSAYKAVGDYLNSQGAFAKPDVKAAPQVIDRRAAQPKTPEAANGDKAAAASVSRTVSKPSKPSLDTLGKLSDEDFLKTFEGRF